VEPLATFFEKRHNGRRWFSLFPDRLLVQGKQRFAGQFETVVPLQGIRPFPNRLWLRYGEFHLALLFFAGSLVLGVLFLGLFRSCATIWAFIVPLSMAIGALWEMAATWRKVEYVQFVRDNGLVAFDVALTTKDRGAFDAFVGRIYAQLEAGAGAGQSAPAPALAPADEGSPEPEGVGSPS
jgi:hypothetical protein